MRQDAEQFLRQVSQIEEQQIDRFNKAKKDLALDEIDALPQGDPVGIYEPRRHSSGLGSHIRSKMEYDGNYPRSTIKAPRWPKGDPRNSH